MAFTTRDGKTQTVLAEINMIPFIDIVLVLLIIFMITAPVIQSGIEVNVPRTRTVREISEQLLVVTIDAKEIVYLQNEKVNVNGLAAAVKEMLPGFKRQSVYIRSDRNVAFGTIAAVLDHLKDGGVQDIVFVTQPLERSR
jgi:biopolymer transport protein ExbD/biopolymer transport protein TolR